FCCPSLAVSRRLDTGPNPVLGGLGRVVSLPWVRNRHTGPNGGQQGLPGLDCCWAQKTAAGFCLAAALGVTIAYAGILPILPRPPARRGISAAGNPPAPWRCPIPIG